MAVILARRDTDKNATCGGGKRTNNCRDDSGEAGAESGVVAVAEQQPGAPDYAYLFHDVCARVSYLVARLPASQLRRKRCVRTVCRNTPRGSSCDLARTSSYRPDRRRCHVCGLCLHASCLANMLRNVGVSLSLARLGSMEVFSFESMEIIVRPFECQTSLSRVHSEYLNTGSG